nr:MAG TPA: capsid vertex protein [Caudoviricetes sp.]
MFIEAGYIYAPYLPLFASQLLVDADFEAQRGFCTIYAKKAVNKYMYHRLTLVDNKQVAAN